MSALWSKQASDRILFWMPLSTPVQDAKRSRKPRSIRRAFGRSSPAMTRNATSSHVFFSIFRDDATPTQYPYTSKLVIMTG